MTRALVLMFATLVAFAVPGISTRADDLKLLEFWNNTNQRVMFSLMKCDYETLQKMAEEMRSNKLKMISGGWQIDAFYAGVETVAPREGQDENDPIMRKCFAKWAAAYPNSPTPVIALAQFLHDSAWIIRGTGYAQEVWPEQWERFGKLMAEAREVLNRAKDYAADDPRWYSLMVQIMKATGADNDAIGAIAREGIGKQPSYYKTYLEMMGALLPQWGGSAKAMDDWAKESVMLSDKKDGQSLYTRLYWYAEDAMNRSDFMMLPVDWARISKGTDDIIRTFPSVVNFERSIKFGCLSYDPAEVTKRTTGLADFVKPIALSSIEPAKRCRWGVDPQAFPGSTIRPSDEPKKVGTN